MAEKEKSGIKFSISNLEDLGYTFKKPEKSIPSDRVDFSLIHSVQINEKENEISVYLKSKYTYGKREPKLVAEFIFKVTYEVEGLEDVIDVDEKGNKSIPDGIIATLFSIGYSTMRGAFFEKSKGTMAERLIIPVINPVTILEKSEVTEENPALSN